MSFDYMTATLQSLLSRLRPKMINRSWILRNVPACYRFIQKRLRAATGGIDWDRVTQLLDPSYQRLWRPARKPKSANYSLRRTAPQEFRWLYQQISLHRIVHTISLQDP